MSSSVTAEPSVTQVKLQLQRVDEWLEMFSMKQLQLCTSDSSVHENKGTHLV